MELLSKDRGLSGRQKQIHPLLEGDKGDTGDQGLPVEDGADGVSGGEIVACTVVGPDNYYQTKIATASCPFGKVAVGGGYQISDAFRKVILSYPSADNVWTVKAVTDGHYSGYVWRFQAYVICIDAPTP